MLKLWLMRKFFSVLLFIISMMFIASSFLKLKDFFSAGNQKYLEIQAVEPESPADKFGLLKNDYIVAVNNVAIHDEKNFFYVLGTAENGVVSLKILRGGVEKNIEAILREEPKNSRLGITYRFVDKSKSKYLFDFLIRIFNAIIFLIASLMVLKKHRYTSTYLLSIIFLGIVSAYLLKNVNSLLFYLAMLVLFAIVGELSKIKKAKKSSYLN